MPLELFAHPFSSYCWKVLIALYENDTPFRSASSRRRIPRRSAEHARVWPLKKMPTLVDDGQVVPEATIIIEHLALRHPGKVRLLPRIRARRSTSGCSTASSTTTS
jgi:glutathione S-transferase